jgi:uncharacterized delta-60 repeat protein
MKLHRMWPVVSAGVSGRRRRGRSNSKFALVRYTPHGTLDTTFGSQGWVITDFTEGDDGARALAFLPDGKVVLTGASDYLGRHDRFALARHMTT